MYRDENLTVREIAAQVKVSYGTVHQDLAQAGVEFRGPWGLRHAKNADEPEESPGVAAFVPGLPSDLQTIADARIETVCRLLREEREAQMTQTEAARRLGMWASTVSRVELARRESYPLPLLIAFCEILGRKFSDIVARAEELVPSEPEEHHCDGG